jgi:hypothetical protein
MVPEHPLVLIRPLKKSARVLLGSQEIATGALIPKIQRVRAFSPDEWEEFVEEWAHSLEAAYSEVRRYGGAGDMGCDVVGFLDPNGFQGRWANYQCKRYGKPLAPHIAWEEIGKLCWYAYSGYYTWPISYKFAAPLDVGLKLDRLLRDPIKLKDGLLENWDDKCRLKIREGDPIPLDRDLAKYVQAADFSIFGSLTTTDLIQQHNQTSWHTTRFGGGLPPRPTVPPAPTAIQSQEIRYVEQLLDAYSDHLGETIAALNDFAHRPTQVAHFTRSREQFFSAEALQSFSRDTVPPGTYERLQQEIYDGVIDTCELGNHPSGFERVVNTVARAAEISPHANPLYSRVETRDKQGICHQLANIDRLLWVRK